MPSGKKARGRKNRAKKEATRFRTLWEPTNLRDNSNSSVNNNATASSCEHMLAALPQIPQEGPAVSFMNCLAGEGFFDEAAQFLRRSVDVVLPSHCRAFQKSWRKRASDPWRLTCCCDFFGTYFLHDSAIEGEKWFHNRAKMRWRFAA